ncbi:protein CURVATURE THYLAKOID 1B, chloroplastic-like isoform X1 [Ananas comosus]|uniref:Protein CURVATURE THYLAKOID 1B, chloroplastic n=1 Tax=Ananas comosus TaxID=4615 RepID=A0A199UI30_ANACO|nr:protein CURVATURE THYLAKOID 1B, chloroplastic-like isoform X1 [Ananas comosus]OAY64394.1 Protein CURVATURE THYLAKOID 1B, chloroplastic [Ananas comosus]
MASSSAAAAAAATCAHRSPALAGAKAPARRHAARRVRLPPLPPPRSAACPGLLQTASCGHGNARNVLAKATGESPAEATTEFPEIVKPVQELWDKLEDKYAVASLAVASIIGLWTAAGVISAIDRLPVVPGILELVGIGYTGWFAYQNLIFTPDREALIAKIKGVYENIIGSS